MFSSVLIKNLKYQNSSGGVLLSYSKLSLEKTMLANALLQ